MTEQRDEGTPRRRRGGQATRTATASSDGDGERPRRTAGAREVLDSARDLADDLGWQWEALSGLRRADEGWTVTMDVLETHRVPSTTDVLAVYEVDLDDGGDLLGYRRLRHYVRGRGDNERG